MQQQQDLSKMSLLSLTAMYNALAPKAIRRWSGKKTVIIDKIKKLQPAREVKEKATEEKMTIGGFTCNLLSRVVDYVDRDGNQVEKDHPQAQPVGMSYKDVLTAVKKQFPRCRTNYNCLRCYAGRMRENGEFVPVHRQPSRWK